MLSLAWPHGDQGTTDGDSAIGSVRGATLYQFAGAITAQDYRWGGLNRSYNYEGLKSKIKLSAGSFFLRPLSLAYCVFWCLHRVILLCAWLRPNPLFSRGHQVDWRTPAPWASFNLNHLFKDSISKRSHILRYCGLLCQHVSLRDTIQAITHPSVPPPTCS